MEDTEFVLLITLITLAASILQIILFFKLWAMTDDVRKLRNNYVFPHDFRLEIRKLILSGKKEKAREILINRFIEKIKNLNYEGLDDNRYFDEVKKNIDNDFLRVKEELGLDLQKIGEDMPEGIKRLNSGEDFNNLF
jgi:hypothetical protein